MVVAEIVNFARALLRDSSAQGSWSDATLINFVDRASKGFKRDVKFPEDRILTPIVSQIQEYQLPDTFDVYRVYIAGQIIVPTTIETLEGRQIRQYDQGYSTLPYSGSIDQRLNTNQMISIPSANVAQPAVGSGGPVGPGTYSPKWSTEPSVAYPVSNTDRGTAPDASSWYQGSRPRYYKRGGYLGFVPIPTPAAQGVDANNVPIPTMITVDCLIVPPTLRNLTDLTQFPDDAVEALSWKVVEYCKFGDSSSQASDDRNYALSKYNEMKKDFVARIRGYQDGEEPGGPKMLTSRSFWTRGVKRNNGGNNTYD